MSPGPRPLGDPLAKCHSRDTPLLVRGLMQTPRVVASSAALDEGVEVFGHEVACVVTAVGADTGSGRACGRG